MFTFRKLTLAAAFGVAALVSSALLSPHANAQTYPAANAPAGSGVAFDTMTNEPTVGAPTATNSFMGQAFNAFDGSGGSLPFRITSFDAPVVNSTGATLNLTGLQLRVQFYGTFSSGTQTNVFSNPIGGPITFGTTVSAAQPFAFATGTYTTFTGFGITGGLPVGSYTNLGMVLNWQGNTGAGFQTIDNLTTAIRGGATSNPFAVGSVPGVAGPTFGYYRNSTGRTDFNFANTDSRQIGNNSALALRIYAAVPEPGSIALVALGGLPLMGVVLRRRK